METFTKGIKTTKDEFNSFIELLQREQTHDITELKAEKEHDVIQNIGQKDDILNDLTIDALLDKVNLIDIWRRQVRCLLKSFKFKHLQKKVFCFVWPTVYSNPRFFSSKKIFKNYSKPLLVEELL